MSRSKHLSLEEARNSKQLDRFAKEHASEGDEQLFDDLLGTMVKTPSAKRPSSSKGRSG